MGDNIEKAANAITNSLRLGGKLAIFGNGGSAADSQHIAAEFVGHEPPLAALALTTDTSALTALANDFGFEYIFERQVRALCKKEDVVIGISTSWKSMNVVRGIVAAQRIGAFTIVLTGRSKTLADLTINVDSEDTQRIQEEHIRIGHRLMELVVRKF